MDLWAHLWDWPRQGGRLEQLEEREEREERADQLLGWSAVCA